MTYIGKRLLKIIPTLIAITFITFILLYIGPSDPARMHFESMGVPYTDSMLASFRAEHGLDQPFIVQYLNWIWQILQGNFGVSYESSLPAQEEVFKAIPYTLSLAINSVLLAVIISVPTGLITAYYKDHFLSKAILQICIVLNSIPSFVLGLLMMLIFSIRLGWLPIISFDNSVAIIYPTLVTAIAMSARYIQQIKAVCERELSQDYVYGMLARGLPMWKILFGSVLRNISVEIVTLIGISFGSLMGGTAIVESLFNWPGVGNLLVSSIMVRDIPVVQATMLWIGISYLLVNLATDILYTLLDPNIRLEGGKQHAME